MADDWQTKTSLADTNQQMLELEVLSDVTFLVGNYKQTIKAHKFELVSRSSVFYAMFCGPLAEPCEMIEVLDLEVDGFKYMLRFIYTTDCLLTADIVMSVLFAAKKYGIVGLVNKCNKYLKSAISTENVCIILQQAHMFDEQDLLKQCLSFICKNGRTVLESADFQCLSFICKNGRTVLESADFLCLTRDTLRMVLGSDELNAPEDAVYTACVRWAEEDCKRSEKSVSNTNSRETLGELVYLIRFTCMTLDTFTSLIAEGGILSAEETVDVFLQLAQKKKSRFNSQPRQYYRLLGSCFMERFTNQSSIGQSHDGKVDAISFSSSKNVLLAGVGLYMPYEIVGEVVGTLECYEKERCLISVHIRLTYHSDAKFVKQLFDTPVHIQKGNLYTLTQTLRGGVTYQGVGGQSCVTRDGIEIRFFKSDKDANSTSVEKGQFPCLIML